MVSKYKEKQTAAAKQVNERKYGRMPRIEAFESDQQGGSDAIGINLLANGHGTEVTNALSQTTITSSLMCETSRKSISQPVECTPFTCENGLGSNQQEGFYRGITTRSEFQQGISGIHDPRQGVDFSSDQTKAYDDFLIYSDGNGPHQDLMFEYFSLGDQHATKNEVRFLARTFILVEYIT